MDIASLQPFLNWVAAHPAWSSLIVGLITYSESLAILGFFVPGVLLLFGIGALIAVGSLGLWKTLMVAAAGALLGDITSYWMGHYFKERLRTFWPFSRHPQLLARGEAFFQRHGGKSVVLGRFVGPMRAIVPAIAGMVGMPLGRFIVIDALSAIAWAPAYIVPGVVFAASLGLAAEVATRLAVLLLLLLGLTWLTVWMVRHVVAYLQPRANSLIGAILGWSRGHRLLGGMAISLLDPYQAETRGLVLFAVMIIVLTIIAVTLIAGAASPIPGTGIDYAVLSALQELSTPLADGLMSVLSHLGDATVNAAVIAAVGLWWAWRRNWPAVVHWVSGLAFGALLVFVYRHWLAVWQPHEVGTPVTEGSVLAHPVMITMLYGFVSVVVARELSSPWRWLPYLAASLIVLAVSVSRLYFGVQVFSELAVTLAVVLLWLVLLGVAYRRHNPPRMHVSGTVAVALLMLGLAGAWHVSRVGEQTPPASPKGAPPEMSVARWWDGGWRALPSHRLDFIGHMKEPFTLQWLSDRADIVARLQRQGWASPPPMTLANVLLWLKPRPRIGELPVLPQVHDGHYERLLLVRAGTAGRQLVLRLWKANVKLTDGPSNASLWVGYVAYQQVKEPLIFLSLPLPDGTFNEPLQRMTRDLEGLRWRNAQQAPGVVSRVAKQVRWNGDVLLIRPGPTAGK